jgi:hypothetical protein
MSMFQKMFSLSLVLLVACSGVVESNELPGEEAGGGGGTGGGSGGGGGIPGPGPEQPGPGPGPGTDPLVDDHDPLAGFPEGEVQRGILCARGNRDPISARLCANPAPTIASLADLQQTLGLNVGNANTTRFAFSGHSSSLVVRSVSAINPRAIIFTRAAGQNPQPNANFIALGFVRGDQFAELVARDAGTGDLNFFLVRFKQACNASPTGCSNADLLTNRIESNWTQVSVYQDVDIKNTVMDCLQCHQPGGPATRKILRMQELEDPWNHFFRDNRAGGQQLIADFRAAHGNNEAVAGVPGNAIGNSDPEDLEDLVKAEGFGNQPNEFNSNQIEDQVAANGTSTTWQALFDRAVNGLAIPVPFFRIRISDPAKLTAATNSYRAVLDGTAQPSTLVDIRDIFSEEAMQSTSIHAKPGLSGRGILVQMCQHCHNNSLDQTISRARFNVQRLDEMSRAEKDLAIARLQLAPDSRLRMPPTVFHELAPAEIQLAIEELRR